MPEINSLIKCYGDRTVLDIEKLCVEKGRTLCVCGPNGSGKSTLLRILAGTLKPDSGSVTGTGRVLYLPQQSVPFPGTVEENILYCVKSAKKAALPAVNDLLTCLRLDGLRDKKAATLSGGELRKLALCRLLINDCDTLLLDEPTAPADIEGVELMHGALEDYGNKTGCTVIMTTHSPAEARQMADRILILNEGKPVEDGSAEDLLKSPSTEWGKKFISQWKL